MDATRISDVASLNNGPDVEGLRNEPQRTDSKDGFKTSRFLTTSNISREISRHLPGQVIHVTSDEEALREHLRKQEENEQVLQMSKRTSVRSRNSTLHAILPHDILERPPRRASGSFSSKLVYYLFAWTINPSYPPLRLWDAASSVFVMFTCWVVPFQIAFVHYEFTKKVQAFISFLDMWFIIDLILHFLTGYYDMGVLVMDRKQIAQKYLSGWFFIDFIAAIPFGNFLDQEAVKLLKYFKLPKLLRLGRLIRHFVRYLKYTGFMTVMFGFLFLVHFSSCIWGAIIAPCTLAHSVVNPICEEKSVWHLYLNLLHYGLSILLSSSDDPLYSDQSIFCAGYRLKEENQQLIPPTVLLIHFLIQVAGMIGIALIIANVVFLVQSWNRAGNAFRKKMDLVSYEMQYLQLPKRIRKQIRQYYDYVWSNNKTMNDNLVLLNDTSMSDSLKDSIARHMYQHVIIKTALFRAADPSMIAHICRSVRMMIFMPGDVIAKKDDIDYDIYIIFRGTVEIVNPGVRDSKPEFLSTGSTFGETSAILEVPRSKSIQACLMCEICFLDIEILDALMAEYSEFKTHLQTIVTQSYRAKLKSLKRKPEEIDKKTAAFAEELRGKIEQRIASHRVQENEVLQNLMQDSTSTLAWAEQNSQTSRRGSVVAVPSSPRRGSCFNIPNPKSVDLPNQVPVDAITHVEQPRRASITIGRKRSIGFSVNDIRSTSSRGLVVDEAELASKVQTNALALGSIHALLDDISHRLSQLELTDRAQFKEKLRQATAEDRSPDHALRKTYSESSSCEIRDP